MQPLWWTKKQTTKEERWKLNVFVHSSWKDIFESNIHILFERQVFCQNLEVFFGSRLSSKWHDGERASRLPYWTNISHGGTNISQILDKYITWRNKYITNIGQIYHTAEQIYHKYRTNISHGGTSDLLFGSSSLPFHSSNPNLDLLVSRKATMTNQTYLDLLQIKMMTMMVDSGLGLNVMLVLDLVWDLERIGFIFPWMLEHSQMEKRADTATISVLFFSDKPC